MAGTSMGLGFMAAFAVSGSVALIANQLHKRLLSDYMKKIEIELRGSRRSSSCHHQAKKKVRFAEDVKEPSSDNKEYRKKKVKKMENSSVLMEDIVLLHQSGYDGAEVEVSETMMMMPMNRKVLYT